MSYFYKNKFYRFDKLEFAFLQLQVKDECTATNPSLDTTIFPRCSSPIHNQSPAPFHINLNENEQYTLFCMGLQTLSPKIQKVRGVKTQPKNVINGCLRL